MYVYIHDIYYVYMHIYLDRKTGRIRARQRETE